MDMVGDTADAVAFASRVSGDGGEVRMQVRSYRFGQLGMTILGAEDEVNQHESQRLCHCEDYRSGFQPSGLGRVVTRGVAPGWYRACLRRFSSCFGPELESW
jgi:hypothetical protein